MKSFLTFLVEKEKDKEPEKDRVGKKTHSEEEIAKKHSLSVDYIEKQIDKGKKVEMEHTKNEEEAEEIARDHLWEFPDYYDRLDKMEKQAKKKWEKNLKENHILSRDGIHTKVYYVEKDGNVYWKPNIKHATRISSKIKAKQLARKHKATIEVK